MPVKYKCGKCGYVFDEDEMIKTWGNRIACPRCEYEIIYMVARSYRIVKAI